MSNTEEGLDPKFPGNCAQCGKRLAPQACAPHKRFCSDKCRSKWHIARRKRAEDLLKQKENESGSQD